MARAKVDAWRARGRPGYVFAVPRHIMHHPWDPFTATVKFGRGFSRELLSVGPGDVLELYDTRHHLLQARVHTSNISKTGRTGLLELIAEMVDFGASG